MITSLPEKVKLVEVSPRDGLQNESMTIPLQDKVAFINLLSDAGFSLIECGSFVSVNKIPQMANSGETLKSIKRRSGTVYSALVPNLKGIQAAIDAGVDEVAIFTAASETFTQKNINCSIDQSIERFASVINLAERSHLRIRAYISCAVACPYEGKISASKVKALADKLIDMGCYEISLGDTIGVATPNDIVILLDQVLRSIPSGRLAVHFHNTYGQALANILTAMQMGIHVIDSSIAGLGGCPYAKGASGNIATEDVLYMLQGMGIETGIDLSKAIAASHFICEKLNKSNQSLVTNAMDRSALE